MPTLSGNCRNADGSPARRLVRVYRVESGALVGQAFSSPSTGAWSLDTEDTQPHFAIQHAATVKDNADNLALAMHFRGANGATNFADECGNLVSLQGNAQISTAQSFFGGSAGLFDGTGDGFIVRDATKLRPGSGDFSLRFAQRYVSKTGYQTIFCKGYNVSGAIVVQTGNGDGKINVYQGATSTLVASETGSTVNTNTWYDIEIERTSGTLKIRRDGTTYASVSDSTNYNSTAQILVCGGSTTGFDNYYFNGYLDEIEYYTGVSPSGHGTRTAEFESFITTSVSGNVLAYDVLTPA